LREHGIRLSEQFLAVPVQPVAGGDLQSALIALMDDPEIRVRFQLALSLGGINAESKLSALARLARRDCEDRWCAPAILSSLGSNSWAFLNQLVKENPRWFTGCTSGQAKFLEQLAGLIGVSHTPAELRGCLGLITQTNTFVYAQLAILAGLADGLGRSPTPLSALLNNPPAELKSELQALKQDFGTVRSIATSSEQPIPERVLAIRILGRGTPALAGEGMLELLQPGQPAEVQASAARAIFELNDQELAKTLFGHWSQYPPASRRRILSATPTSPVATAALLEMIESGKLSPVEVDVSLRQALSRTQNDSIKQRFKKVFQSPASDREEVVRRFQPALNLTGNRERGAAIFSRTCLTCHSVEGKGGHVGPDLSGAASRPKQALLVDVIDPSRAVSADFVNYTVETTTGTTISGLIVAETASSVALRRANEPDATILRSEIKELRAEGKSLMPEGLEQGLNDQDIADLLAFLQKPEAHLLLEVK